MVGRINENDDDAPLVQDPHKDVVCQRLSPRCQDQEHHHAAGETLFTTNGQKHEQAERGRYPSHAPGRVALQLPYPFTAALSFTVPASRAAAASIYRFPVSSFCFSISLSPFYLGTHRDIYQPNYQLHIA